MQGAYQVRYDEGAYYSTAVVTGDDSLDEQVSAINIDLAYYDTLLARYDKLRRCLTRKPPAALVARLSSDQPTVVPRLTTALCGWWRWQLRSTWPLPTQLASMDKSSVLRLISLLRTGNLVKKGKSLNAMTSCWVWGLLARLPDRGELMSEEIGIIRELGKTAALMGWGSGNAEDNDDVKEEESQQDDEAEAADPDETRDPGQGEDLNLAHSKARLLAHLQQQATHPLTTDTVWNLRATVDMILSVVGEVYGQRDLLEFRGQAWCRSEQSPQAQRDLGA